MTGRIRIASMVGLMLASAGTAHAQGARVPSPSASSLRSLPPPAWADPRGAPTPAFLDVPDQRSAGDRPTPTPEQVEAMGAMEAEVERLARAGRAYRELMRSTLARDHRRLRRERDAAYERQIREEDRLHGEARDRAIRLLEELLGHHPHHPTHTPDAMFRLGELYYSRTAEQDTTDAASPDFSPTVELYRGIVDRFPSYSRIDAVYYALGYCLNSMGNIEESRRVWLRLVCATQSDEDEGAQSLDPYVGCSPVTPSARFVREVWLRIGEQHFDDDADPRALDYAIGAYRHVLDDPTDRNYGLALYKYAWAHYRARRYPESIEHFARLVDWSDEQLAQTGRAGSELRREAIQYLGIAFAYDDWNENTVPDHLEGQPTGIQRIQDAHLLPQERPWTSEIYLELAQVYFEETKFSEAMAAWELFLARWPRHARAPEATSSFVRACQRMQPMGGLSAWAPRRECLPRGAPSEGPAAEAALIDRAIDHHRLAQELRAGRPEVEQRRRAIDEYRLAAEHYRRYLQTYPNNPGVYDVQYALSDALYGSEQYEESAVEYAAVRDSSLDDRHASASARRVVEALRHLVRRAEQRGELDVRDDPEADVPQPEGQPPRVRPLEVPPLVQRLAQAREIYLARVPEAQDQERMRATYDYENALLLDLYGYWPQARARLLRIYEERCTGPSAHESGHVAWLALRRMAMAMSDVEDVVRLTDDLANRACTFGLGVSEQARAGSASEPRTGLQYAQAGNPPGSTTAEQEAHAHFLSVDSLQELQQLRVNVGRQPGVPELVRELNRQIQDAARLTIAVARRYEPIFAYRPPAWTIAALTRQARAHAMLAQAVRSATVMAPEALLRAQPAALPMPSPSAQLEAHVREVLEQHARPIECAAIVRYVRAARVARAADLDTEQSREAFDRLQSYGEARVAECIAEARESDPTLDAYRSGELRRARRGEHVEIRPGVSPPPLASDED